MEARIKEQYGKNKEWEVIRYQTECRSIIRRIVICVIMITIVPLLWYLCFIYYPQTTMIDIKGVVVEKKLYLSGNRKSARIYAVKLDNYSSSLAIRYKGRSVKNHFREILEGTEVIVQIQKKDLDKIKNSNIQIPLEYSKSQFLHLPRMYGISTNEKVIITPQKALWDFSTLYVLSVISTIPVYFALFFGIGLLGWDLKGLYHLRKRKSIEKN